MHFANLAKEVQIGARVDSEFLPHPARCPGGVAPGGAFAIARPPSRSKCGTLIVELNQRSAGG
jgi:hypothetical protein